MTQYPGLLQAIQLRLYVDEVIATSAIEGITLDRSAVVEALARRFGLALPAPIPAFRKGGAKKVCERQYQLVRLLTRGEPGWIDVRGHMAVAGVSKATATRDLAELVALGQLQREGTGKAARYRPSRRG